MKRILNKWQFLFRWGNCWHALGRREFNFAIIKITSFPAEGCVYEKKHYKGFWLRKEWRTWPDITIQF